jgi:hypothetical protein
MKSNVYKTARVLALATLFTLFCSLQKASAQQFLTQIDGWNAYVHLPDDYNDSVNKRYPLICFIPGTGETGTTASNLLTYGPSKFVAEGHNMQFMVNGKLEKPIVISLQPVNLWPNAWTINKKLDSVMARYRCDLQRINVTGLSMGGWSWVNYVNNYNPLYTKRITSIVSMSSPPPDNTVNAISLMRFYPLEGGTAWFFEGNLDLRGNDKIRDTMNKYVPGSARYTLYPGGHSGWNTFYNPSWKENGESIYTWMLKQKKALISGPVPPQAHAGTDSSFSNILTSFSLNGQANDPNGLLINYNWTKVSGPTMGTISNPTGLQTSVTGLSMGTYFFELKVTNSLGFVAKDTLIINNGLAVLPVILTEFSAKMKDRSNVLLQWKTTSEVNSDYFLIEKSFDGLTFSETARISSKAVGSFGASYAYTDLFSDNGVNFYRLKMVDKDGQFSFSKIVSVTLIKESANSMFISSVFASNSLVQFNFRSIKSAPASVIITDGSGKKLFTSNIFLNAGENRVSKILNIPKGVYHLNIICGNENTSRSFMRL